MWTMAPLATWKLNAIRSAINAAADAHNPTVIATPHAISPSGTSLANTAVPLRATCSRYHRLSEPAGAAWSHDDS